MNFKDAVVVVTGAASGIGRALAERAVQRGARVAVADIEIAKATDAAAAINAACAGEAGRAIPFQVDVSNSESFRVLADNVARELGSVNVLFNNAGVFAMGGLDRTSANNFRWVFEVNVFGTFNGITAFLPALQASAAAGRLAHIVNTGSENSLGLPAGGQFTAYTATKHAILGMSDGLRRDLNSSGIGVSVLCPGAVNTALWDSTRNRPESLGGSKRGPAALAQGFARGQDPAYVARIAFEGMEAGEFIIVTNPAIRKLAEKRNAEVAQALDIADQRCR